MSYRKTYLVSLALLLPLAPAAAQDGGEPPIGTVAAAARPAEGAPSARIPAAPPADGAAPDTSAAAEERAPAAIEVGTGSVQFSGLVQAWYSSEHDGDASTFRLRRAELKFAGDLTPRVQWVVALDPAKALKINNRYATVGETTVVTGGEVSQSSLILQDAHMTFRLGRLEVDAGQFKLPLSLEGSAQSSGRIETVERALFISQGKYGLVRDLGLMVSGSVHPSVAVQLGAFNGAGEYQNSVDADARKTLAGRLVLSDAWEGLQLGASGAWSGEADDDEVRRDRLGLEGRLARGPLTLRSEVMRGWDGAFERLGYYALAAYRVAPSVEITGRYDVWDADTRADEARQRDLVGVVSYFVSGPNAKIQASLVRRDFGAGLPAENRLQMNFQASW